VSGGRAWPFFVETIWLIRQNSTARTAAHTEKITSWRTFAINSHPVDRTVHNQTISPETITTIDDKRLAEGLSDFQYEDLMANIGLMDELREFDVVQARLEGEYGVPTRLEPLPHGEARFAEGLEKVVDALPWE